MAGLREVRAFKSGTVIAITPFPNIDQRTFSEAQLCDMVSQASQPYVKVSKEQAVVPFPLSHDGMVGCRVSFTAAQEGEKPFAVLPNRHHASVSTYIFSHKFVVFSISVASEQLPNEDYRAATKAIEQLR